MTETTTQLQVQADEPHCTVRAARAGPGKDVYAVVGDRGQEFESRDTAVHNPLWRAWWQRRHAARGPPGRRPIRATTGSPARSIGPWSSRRRRRATGEGMWDEESYHLVAALVLAPLTALAVFLFVGQRYPIATLSVLAVLGSSLRRPRDHCPVPGVASAASGRAGAAGGPAVSMVGRTYLDPGDRLFRPARPRGARCRGVPVGSWGRPPERGCEAPGRLHRRGPFSSAASPGRPGACTVSPASKDLLPGRARPPGRVEGVAVPPGPATRVDPAAGRRCASSPRRRRRHGRSWCTASPPSSASGSTPGCGPPMTTPATGWLLRWETGERDALTEDQVATELPAARSLAPYRRATTLVPPTDPGSTDQETST